MLTNSSTKGSSKAPRDPANVGPTAVVAFEDAVSSGDDTAVAKKILSMLRDLEPPPMLISSGPTAHFEPGRLAFITVNGPQLCRPAWECDSPPPPKLNVYGAAAITGCCVLKVEPLVLRIGSCGRSSHENAAAGSAGWPQQRLARRGMPPACSAAGTSTHPFYFTICVSSAFYFFFFWFARQTNTHIHFTLTIFALRHPNPCAASGVAPRSGRGLRTGRLRRPPQQPLERPRRVPRLCCKPAFCLDLRWRRRAGGLGGRRGPPQLCLHPRGIQRRRRRRRQCWWW